MIMWIGRPCSRRQRKGRQLHCLVSQRFRDLQHPSLALDEPEEIGVRDAIMPAHERNLRPVGASETFFRYERASAGLCECNDEGIGDFPAGDSLCEPWKLSKYLLGCELNVFFELYEEAGSAREPNREAIFLLLDLDAYLDRADDHAALDRLIEVLPEPGDVCDWVSLVPCSEKRACVYAIDHVPAALKCDQPMTSRSMDGMCLTRTPIKLDASASVMRRS